MKTFLPNLLTLSLFFTSLTSLVSQVIWDKNYANSSSFEQILETGDGGYFALSSSAYFKISSQGDTIFTNKKAGLKDESFKDCAYLQDGSIALAISGRYLRHNAMLMVINKNGNIVSSKEFTKFTSISHMVSSGGNIYSIMNSGEVTKWSSNLDSSWSWKPAEGETLSKTYINNKGNLVGLTYNGTFVELNANNGEIVLTKKTFNKLRIPGDNNNRSTIYQVNNFYYFLFPEDLLHAKISLSGDSISVKNLFGTRSGQGTYGSFVPEDNGFTFLYNTKNDRTFHLIRTDNNYKILDSISFGANGAYFQSSKLLKDASGNYLLGGYSRIIKYRWETDISGAVYAGNEHLDKGISILFKLVDGEYKIISKDAIPYTTIKDYSLKTDSGKYLVMVTPVPGSKFNNSYLPTYYIKSTQWSTANTIDVLNESITGKDIQLVPLVSADASWNTGNETIKGNVYDATSANTRTEEASNNLSSAIVYLLNSSGAKITYALTTEDGTFEFKNVKAGDYKIMVEYAGTQMVQPVVVKADNDPLTTQAIDFSVTKQLVTEIRNSVTSTSSLSIAPVPASEVLHVTIPEYKNTEGSKIIIINAIGNIVYEESMLGRNNLSINIEGLDQGIYLVKWINQEGQLVQKFTK